MSQNGIFRAAGEAGSGTFKKLLLMGAIFVATWGTAHADVIVDGIDLPSGATIVAQVIEEDLITATGQNLVGIGIINSIQQGLSLPTYTYGQGGKYLTFAFTGFTSHYILAPTISSAGYIEFTGGNAEVYEQNSAPNLATCTGGCGSLTAQAADVANAEAGSLFLGVQAETFATTGTVQAASGPTTTTLEAEIPSNAALNSFSNANGAGIFDVTGGDAGANFNTCSFSVPGASAGTSPANCAAGTVDLTFNEGFSSTASGDFEVSGTANVKADVQGIPEPASLSLLGAGLLSLGIIRRRRLRR